MLLLAINQLHFVEKPWTSCLRSPFKFVFVIFSLTRAAASASAAARVVVGIDYFTQQGLLRLIAKIYSLSGNNCTSCSLACLLATHV